MIEPSGRVLRPRAERPLKVVHLIPTFMTDHGPSNGILAQLRAHTPSAIEAEVWAMYDPPADRDPSTALASVGATYRRLGGSRGFVDLIGAWRLVAQLRRAAPDIVHAHLVRANVYAGLLRPLLGGSVVLCTMRAVEFYFDAGNLSSRLVRAAERRTQRNVARYISVSKAVRDAVVERLGVPAARSVAILNAVDLRPFVSPPSREDVRARLDIPRDAIVIGTVGVIEPRKNVESFVRLVARLRARSPQCAIIGLVVGDGPERAHVEQLANSLNLGASLRFLGFRSDVASLLPAFDIFALTSKGEGLPRAVMEAMAAGIPCVVYDVGGNREAVMDGREGFVHALSDEEGFASSVERLVEDDALRVRLGAAARTAAFERFSPERLAREYESLYEEVLSENAGTSPLRGAA